MSTLPGLAVQAAVAFHVTNITSVLGCSRHLLADRMWALLSPLHPAHEEAWREALADLDLYIVTETRAASGRATALIEGEYSAALRRHAATVVTSFATSVTE